MNQTQNNPENKQNFNCKVIAVLILLIIIAGIFAGIYLIRHGDLEKTDPFGNTPLMEAVKLLEFNRVEALIKRGADVNATDNAGDTPLLVALKNNHREIAHVLFVNGAELNVEDEAGNTPLLLAVKSDDYETTIRFIKSGSDVNVINEAGEHPLTVALQRGNDEIFSLLMEEGADLVVQPIGHLPVGSLVKDITSTWRFRGGGNYSGRTIKDVPLEWLLIAHEHFGEDKSLFLTREIVAKYEFNSKYSLLGGRDSWHNSRIRDWVINTFYRRLSEDFKDAVESCVTRTGGFVIPDEKVFLLSQVELNLGRDNIVGDHGEVIDFFEIPGSRMANFDDYSFYYWTRSAELNVEEDKRGDYYKPRYRVRFVAPGGEVGSEYPLMENGGVRPALNLNSETLVTTYTIDGSHIIVWGNTDPVKRYLNE